MKISSIVILLVGLVVLLLSGCSKEVVQGEEAIAQQYVEDQGFIVTASKGEVARYTLDKSMLSLTGSHVNEWSVQQEAPDSYFGKEVVIYGFIVSKHPLSKMYKASIGVYVMLTGGKVIGGYSLPEKDEKGALLVGGVYSLTGKSLEEMTGMSYKEWLDSWNKKYGSTN